MANEISYHFELTPFVALLDATLPSVMWDGQGQTIMLMDGQLPEARFNALIPLVSFPKSMFLYDATLPAINGEDDGLAHNAAYVDPGGEEPEELSFEATLSDSLFAIRDAISFSRQRHRIVNISDTLRVISDLVYPPPIEATHFDGAVSDTLQTILDSISITKYRDWARSVSDTLQVIQDSLSWGLVNAEMPTRWVAPVTITPRVSTIANLYLAAHAVRHPEYYFEPRIKSYGTFTRAISAPAGFIKTGDVNLTVLDPDNSIRQRIASKTIRKAKAEVRLGYENGRFIGFLRPLIREVGTVSQPADGELTIPLRDFLFDRLSEKTPAETWSPSSANFADAILSVLVEMMGVEESLDRINYPSFDETRIRVADLVCSGSLEEQITYGELLTRLQRSSNIDIFSDKNDRVSVHYTIDDEDPTVDLDDILRLYKGTVRQALADPHFNRLPYKYNRSGDTWTEAVYDNPADQAAMDGEIVEDEPLQMYFVADAATALTVIERRAQYLDLDSFRFEGEIPLIPVLEELELADLVSITHFGGIKSGGYVAEQFKILELSMDVDHLKYRIKGIRRRLPPPSRVDTPERDEETPIYPPTVDHVGIYGTAKVNSRCGPFYNDVEGELFGVFVDPDNENVVRVWGTTDYGITWAVLDAANQPSLDFDIVSFDCYAIDGVIHVATQETNGRVAYHVFDMATKTWSIVDEQIVASCSSVGSYQCVSIECRYPAGEPVVYFQGDRELKTGQFWERGYYSIKQGGAWSAPLCVTPDPGLYSENNDLGWWSAHAVSSSCYVNRVVAGRENRMHFFYEINPAVSGVQWSPDEYANTMDANLVLGGRQFLLETTIAMTASRNIGGAIAYADRSKLCIPRKQGYGGLYVTSYAEGPALSQLGAVEAGYVVQQGAGMTENPAVFIGTDASDKLYLAAVYWPGSTYVSHQESLDDSATWSAIEKAGPTGAPASRGADVLMGNYFMLRGHLYMALFASENSFPVFRWYKVDDLPYPD